MLITYSILPPKSVCSKIIIKISTYFHEKVQIQDMILWFLCIKNIQTFSTPNNVMFYSQDHDILYDWKQVLCALEQIPIL